MYMGFFVRGTSMMACAIAIIVCYALLYAPIIAWLLPLIWCLSFFDAINLGWASPEDFAQQTDKPFYERFFGLKRPHFSGKPNEKKIFGWTLIIIGALVLLYNLYRFLYDIFPEFIREGIGRFFDYGPRLAAAVLIIAVGIWMMKGNKREIENDEHSEMEEYNDEQK
jgi:hypothetical protein